MLVAHYSDRGVEEVPKNGWRQALVEAERAFFSNDIVGNTKSIGGASGGEGERLAVKLKPSLCEVYGKG